MEIAYSKMSRNEREVFVMTYWGPDQPYHLMPYDFGAAIVLVDANNTPQWILCPSRN